MNARLRRALGPLLELFALYRIYAGDGSAPVGDEELGLTLAPLGDAGELTRSPERELRTLAGYAGEDAHGFGAWLDGELAAACWFWVGARYRTRNFWPLNEGEAKLVDLATGGRFRGRGIGPRLIRFASARMRERGYGRLYARVWHSNRPSLAAFARAGWVEVATVFEVRAPGFARPWRLVRRRPTQAGGPQPGLAGSPGFR